VKNFKGRLAILWELEKQASEVTWTMDTTAGGNAALTEMVHKINDHVRRKVSSAANAELIEPEPAAAHEPVPTLPAIRGASEGFSEYRPALWEKITVVVAACLVLLLIVWLAIRNAPFKDPNLVVMLRIVLSLAIAALAAAVPGFLGVGIKANGLAIRAGGALALFVISFFFTPQVIVPPSEKNGSIREADAAEPTSKDRQHIKTPSLFQGSTTADEDQIQVGPPIPTGWTVDPASLTFVIENSEGREGEGFSFKILSYTPHVAYEVRTFHDRPGGSGKLRFHFEYDIVPIPGVQRLVHLGSSKDPFVSSQSLVFRGANGDVVIARGDLNVQVPVRPGDTLYFHPEGNANTEAVGPMPAGTSMVLISRPRENLLVYEEFWGNPSPVQKEPGAPKSTNPEPAPSREPQKTTTKKEPEPQKPGPPKNPLEGLEQIGHTTDACSKGRIVVRGLKGDVTVIRGQPNVAVPVSATSRTLVWHCTGSKDDNSEMPLGTSVVVVSWPNEGGGRKFNLDFWGKR